MGNHNFTRLIQIQMKFIATVLSTAVAVNLEAEGHYDAAGNLIGLDGANNLNVFNFYGQMLGDVLGIADDGLPLAAPLALDDGLALGRLDLGHGLDDALLLDDGLLLDDRLGLALDDGLLEGAPALGTGLAGAAITSTEGGWCGYNAQKQQSANCAPGLSCVNAICTDLDAYQAKF